MTQQAATIRFTIGPRDGSGLPTLIAYTPGGTARGPLALPTGDAYQALLASLDTLEIDADALTSLGRMLFDALFPPEVRDAYRATHALLAQGQRLRLVLDIPVDATDIATAPWEYLYDPETNAPLALRDTSVVRYLPQPVRVPALEITPPLRVLLSAAQTNPPVNVQRELTAVAQALAALGDRVQVTVEPHLTAETLQDLLRQDYHVWHFVGHGSVGKHGAGQLVLEDVQAQGDSAPLDAEQVAALLAGSTVRLAVLDACGSAKVRNNPMRSIATALVAAGVPAVIAMQLPVPEETTRTFAVALYQALADGEPIDACVTEGRKAVLTMLGSRPDWGIPVVLTRTLDGRLFAPPATAAPTALVVSPARPDRNRQTLLQKVRRFWIDGVLHDSLAQAVTLDLGLEKRLDALQQSWDAVIQRPGEATQQLPPGTRLADVFDEQAQALLILGAPGTGKTTLLLELAHLLLDRADADPSAPLPVVFNLSSWAARRGPLADWLVEELFARYDVPRALGRQWVGADQVLPLLDGLDEVAEPHREACAAEVNAFREAHGLLPIAVCCRTADYEGLTTKLRLAGSVVVQLLAPEQVDAALAAGGEQLAGLRAAIRVDAGLQELAQTPLMLSVMMLAYRGVGVTVAQGGGQEERRDKIFAAYIEAMFSRRGVPRYGREPTLRWLTWLAQQMRQHAQTVFLIEGLQPDWLPDERARTLYTLHDRLGWGLVVALLVGAVVAIRLSLAGLAYPEALAVVLCIALIIGCGCALFGGGARVAAQRPTVRSVGVDVLIGGAIGWLVGAVIFGLIVTPTEPLVSPLEAVAMGGLGGGFIFALLGGLVGRPGWSARQVTIIERLHWSGRRALGVAAGSGCIVAVLGAIGTALFVIAAAGRLDSQAASPLGNQVLGAGFGLLFGLLIGSVLGLVGGLIGGIVGGLEGGDIATTTRPNQGVRRSGRTAAVVGTVVGLIAGLITWPIGLVTGFIVGLLFALAYGGYAILSHLVLRVLLWRRGVLPWDYAAFLDAAAERVFLRKVGGGYIFVHRLLLEHFAAAGTTLSAASPTAAPTPAAGAIDGAVK